MVLLTRSLKYLKKNWLRIAAHVGSLVPLAWLIWQYTQGAFLIDPIREITTLTGRTALILLLLSLACMPLSTLTGFKGGVRVRRALGLYAFMYVGLHFLTFVWLDYRLDLEMLQQAVLDQRYVLVGLAAGLILLALALTSTRGWQKRLGKNWKRLHRWVYLAGILAVVHFLWLVKDIRLPLRYAAVLAALLVLRLPPARKAISRTRHRLVAGWRQRRTNADVTTS